jgi:hypothetical protein
VTSRSAALAGTALAWTFAAMLAYAALHPELTIFEGYGPLRSLLTLAFVASSAVYWLWLRSAERARPAPTSFARAAAPAAPVLVAALASPPISSDPLLYLHYGSMALAGKNPYLAASGAFESPFSGSVVWDLTCPYGPLALGLFALAALLPSALAAVAALKLLWLGAHLLGAYACFRAEPGRRTLFARAFLLNPVLLLAYVVDAHVDALMAALLLVGCVALARDRARLALLGFVAATLTKSIALPALALWFAWALSRRRYALALFGAGLLTGTATLLALTSLPTPSAWQSLLAPVPNTGRSIQHVLVLLGPTVGFDGANAAATYSWVARAGFVITAAALWARAVRSRGYTAHALARDFALVLLLACLFVVPFVPWWYGALVIAAALWSTEAAALRPVALIYGFCSAFTLSAGSGLSRAGLIGALVAIVPTTALLLRAARAALGTRYWPAEAHTPPVPDPLLARSREHRRTPC